MKRILRLAFVCSMALTPFGSFAQKALPAPVRAWKQGDVPAPPGMSYIPGGSVSIKYGLDDDSSSAYRYSLSPFFIDKGEITNKQYREFVQWVIDSVAVTTYLKNDKFFYKSKGVTDSNQRRINWNKVRNAKIWKTRKSSVRNALAAMYQDGEIKKDLYTFAIKYTKCKPGSKQDGKIVREVINVYPNTSVWTSDFPNSGIGMTHQDYFTIPMNDDYPVVGISWKQARAYCYWRSLVRKESDFPKFMRDSRLPYTLPSEAQWLRAAIDVKFPDESEKESGEAIVNNAYNYKQNEGEYTEDGSAGTSPVLSGMPNINGLYNMKGNVSEWTADVWTQSSFVFAHDLDPVISYDADPNDGLVLHAKVVKGGSWKDAAKGLGTNYRTFDLDNAQHSYIGFRCVMAAPELIGKQLITKKRKNVKKK